MFSAPPVLDQAVPLLTFFLRVQEWLAELGIPVDEMQAENSEVSLSRDLFNIYREYRDDMATLTWSGALTTKHAPVVEVTVQWWRGHEVFLSFKHPAEGMTMGNMIDLQGFVEVSLETDSWTDDPLMRAALEESSTAYKRLNGLREKGGRKDLLEQMVAFFRERAADRSERP